MLYYKLLSSTINTYIFKSDNKIYTDGIKIEEFNDDIIFSFSYITVCIMHISYFSHITPEVISIFLFSILLLYIVDYFKLRNKKNMEEYFPIVMFPNYYILIFIFILPNALIEKYYSDPISQLFL